jgi:hypothetical protein
VIQLLAKHPHDEFAPGEIVKELGTGTRESILRILTRLAGSGKGSGPVERSHRGYYRYCSEKHPPILDEIALSGRIGIENLTLVKSVASFKYEACLFGDTGPKRTPDPKGETDTERTNGQTDTQTDTIRTREEESVRTVSVSTSSDGPPIQDKPSPRPGYPHLLPTGQEVQWWIYPNGTEMIIFVANGRPAFPIETVLLLMEGLKKDGLGGEWERVSLEWNIDSKRFTIAEPVSFQVTEKELLKFYQHGFMARLEGVDRRLISFEDTLLCLVEVYEKGHGRTALKEVTKMKKEVKELTDGMRLMQNVHRSLSNRVWALEPKSRRQRKDRPLIPEGSG